MKPSGDLIQKAILAFLIFVVSVLMPHIALAQKDELSSCGRCLLLTDLGEHRIVAADLQKNRIVWEWSAIQSNLPAPFSDWFLNYSDVKPVYGNSCLLISSSKGGIALIRVRDKKALFYAYAGGNTHSIELLPDGNIVAASSTGNYLTIFRVDTLGVPGSGYKKQIYLPSVHNVVWDRKRALLYSAGKNKFYTLNTISTVRSPTSRYWIH